MATSKGEYEKSIKYGWFKDKISSKLENLPGNYFILQNCEVSFTFYPNLPIFLHRYIGHICDILQICRMLIPASIIIYTTSLVWWFLDWARILTGDWQWWNQSSDNFPDLVQFCNPSQYTHRAVQRCLSKKNTSPVAIFVLNVIWQTSSMAGMAKDISYFWISRRRPVTKCGWLFLISGYHVTFLSYSSTL